MAKQQAAQKYIFKISTSRLKKAKWDLTLSLPDARRNEEMISLNDSLMLRWIDELNGLGDTETEVRSIRQEIALLKRLPHSVTSRAAIKRLYARLDEVQFKPDYLHLVIDKDKDLSRACKGFKVNGTRFVRLLGTNGGVKNSTIVFVSEKLAPELRRRIDNGRDLSIPQIPAKLEAYRALTCSGSIPVSMPRGVLLVEDCETVFKEDIIHLNDEAEGEPVMQVLKDYEIRHDESDGYGLILPSLAARWSEELKLGYVASGFNTRNSFEKGVVFCFDFIDFAEKVAGSYIVKDAWGHEVDIREVELVLTTSMLKLWKCYNSMEHYLRCCEENHYSFGVAKVSPRELENERQTNYQFLQSYNLTDEQLQELIQPTMDAINGVLTGDYRQALLYLCGTGLTEETVLNSAPPIARAIMAEPRLHKDPYVRHYLYNMIRKRIDDAKIGVLDVHGNYSIVCGDPYALCQSMWGLPVTGLLKAGEIYNRYWIDAGAENVAVFRAPMSCHNNILQMKVAKTEEMLYWYQHITTCTLVNAWDSLCAALNGMDKDGDLVFLTDNRVLVENVRPTKTVFCIQRSGERTEVTEEDLIRSNIASFGNDIGKITNRVTSMFDVQVQFEPGSPEYETLEYRIICGQLFQQNAIDKAKGIVAKPMPRSWFDKAAITRPENPTEDEQRIYELNCRIVADKKPYFMRYIYPTVMRDYRDYMESSRAKCFCEYGVTLDELLERPEGGLTDSQKDFLYYFHKRIPVGVNDCIMNRICRAFEAEFRGKPATDFSDVQECRELLLSGVACTDYQKSQVAKVVREYQELLQRKAKESCTQLAAARKGERDVQKFEEFRRDALLCAVNRNQLCDIMVELCYNTAGKRQFMWGVIGEELAALLAERNGGRISFPVRDECGDILYRGMRFSMHEMEVRDE